MANLVSKVLDALEGKVMIFYAIALAFLIINFQESFGLAFLGIAFANLTIVAAEQFGWISRVTNISFGTNGWTNALILGVVIWGVFIGLSMVAQSLSFQSVVNLQSERVLALQTSKVTGALAQSVLVPFVENIAFFGQGLQLALLGALNFTTALGLGSGIGPFSLAGIIASVIIGLAFAIFHLTAKINQGTPGLWNTAIFGFVLSMASLATSDTAPGIITHILNNGYVSLPLLSLGGAM